MDILVTTGRNVSPRKSQNRGRYVEKAEIISLSPKLTTGIEVIKWIGRASLFGFVMFYDRILAWYLGLAWQLTWSVGGVVFAVTGAFLYARHRWPSKFQPGQHEAVREGLGQVQDSLLAFLFVGHVDVFYKLDVVLSSFYWHWTTWLVFGVQALMLSNVMALKYPQFNWGLKISKFVWGRIRRLATRRRR